MGKRLDWQALPVAVELLGVRDVPLLVDQLLILRDTFQESA